MTDVGRVDDTGVAHRFRRRVKALRSPLIWVLHGSGDRSDPPEFAEEGNGALKVTEPLASSPLRALPRSARESARGTPRPLSFDPPKGYHHPLVATRAEADTGEIVHSRVRIGRVGSGCMVVRP